MVVIVVVYGKEVAKIRSRKQTPVAIARKKTYILE